MCSVKARGVADEARAAMTATGCSETATSCGQRRCKWLLAAEQRPPWWPGRPATSENGDKASRRRADSKLGDWFARGKEKEKTGEKKKEEEEEEKRKEKKENKNKRKKKKKRKRNEEK